MLVIATQTFWFRRIFVIGCYRRARSFFCGFGYNTVPSEYFVKNLNMSVIIYHNPRCSKSRQTLALLEEQAVAPEIIEYLAKPPTSAELKKILKKLGMTARELLRTGEDAYKSLNLANQDLTEQQLINAMIENPKLIQRPIVINGDKAALGRPPENVLDIL